VLDVHDTMPELYRYKFPGLLGAIGVPVMKMEERLSAWCADLVLAVHEPHRPRLALRCRRERCSQATSPALDWTAVS